MWHQRRASLSLPIALFFFVPENCYNEFNDAKIFPLKNDNHMCVCAFVQIQIRLIVF